MQRLHLNLSVADLDRSVEFYTHLFGSEPTVTKPDYAKWILDDPRVNFAITTHGEKTGIDHLGLQAEDETEFSTIRSRLNAADGPILDQPDVTCCYARSTKAWVHDPDGIAWETFTSLGDSAVYGDGSEETAARILSDLPSSGACCNPGSPTT